MATRPRKILAPGRFAYKKSKKTRSMPALRIAQNYELKPEGKTPTAAHVSERFHQSLQAFHGGRLQQVLQRPHFRPHIVTSGICAVSASRQLADEFAAWNALQPAQQLAQVELLQ